MWGAVNSAMVRWPVKCPLQFEEQFTVFCLCSGSLSASLTARTCAYNSHKAALMVCKFKFCAPFNLNSWGWEPVPRANDKWFLVAMLVLSGHKLLGWYQQISSLCTDNILPKKGKCGITPDILMTHIKCLWLEGGSCFRYYIQSGSRSQCTARHNDARLRTIKLTQNYIDDIFWARKFHAIRANGVDKISAE